MKKKLLIVGTLCATLLVGTALWYQSHCPHTSQPKIRICYHCEKCGRQTTMNNPFTQAPQKDRNNTHNFTPVITRITSGMYRPIIETKRLRFRDVCMRDLDDLYSWACKDEVAQSTTWKTHKTKEKSKRIINEWLTKYRQGKTAPWGIVLKENNRLIGTGGFVEYVPEHRRAIIGYSLDSTYWGKGYATEAAKAFIEYGIKHLKLNRIESIVRVDNIASRRVMEKAGMSYEFTSRGYWRMKDELQSIHQYSILKKDIVHRLAGE